MFTRTFAVKRIVPTYNGNDSVTGYRTETVALVPTYEQAVDYIADNCSDFDFDVQYEVFLNCAGTSRPMNQLLRVDSQYVLYVNDPWHNIF